MIRILVSAMMLAMALGVAPMAVAQSSTPADAVPAQGSAGAWRQAREERIVRLQERALSSAERRRLERAGRDIAAIATDDRDLVQLDRNQRMKLFNADQVIAALERGRDRMRTICRQVTRAGTRLPTTECLTVEEREQRRRDSREATEDWQGRRLSCIPTAENPCNN